ncbi:hypothetical protein HY417_02335 [Candidatus Kaiserbacteria bacterium]|nr:hypothetical protein [Candidatus Kaiserbacteria bacterium]
MPERLFQGSISQQMKHDIISFAQSVSLSDLTVSERNPPSEAVNMLMGLPPIVADIASGDFLEGSAESPHKFGKWEHIAMPFDVAGQSSNMHMYAIDYRDPGDKVVDIFFVDGIERTGKHHDRVFDSTGDATISVSRKLGQPDKYEVEWTRTFALEQGRSIGLHRMIVLGEYVLQISKNKSKLSPGALISPANTPKGGMIPENQRTHFEHMEHIWDLLVTIGLATKLGAHEYEYTGVRNLLSSSAL